MFIDIVQYVIVIAKSILVIVLLNLIFPNATFHSISECSHPRSILRSLLPILSCQSHRRGVPGKRSGSGSVVVIVYIEERTISGPLCTIVVSEGKHHIYIWDTEVLPIAGRRLSGRACALSACWCWGWWMYPHGYCSLWALWSWFCGKYCYCITWVPGGGGTP